MTTRRRISKTKSSIGRWRGRRRIHGHRGRGTTTLWTETARRRGCEKTSGRAITSIAQTEKPRTSSTCISTPASSIARAAGSTTSEPEHTGQKRDGRPSLDHVSPRASLICLSMMPLVTYRDRRPSHPIIISADEVYQAISEGVDQHPHLHRLTQGASAGAIEPQDVAEARIVGGSTGARDAALCPEAKVGTLITMIKQDKKAKGVDKTISSIETEINTVWERERQARGRQGVLLHKPGVHPPPTKGHPRGASG
mmetsp:Transcript_1825/g.6695  ORF Transcript_1825/g.6695 Transcript_1825/m.6695 type:complete len:254 (+) Transcript_1825:1415-2176(+)